MLLGGAPVRPGGGPRRPPDPSRQGTGPWNPDVPPMDGRSRIRLHYVSPAGLRRNPAGRVRGAGEGRCPAMRGCVSDAFTPLADM